VPKNKILYLIKEKVAKRKDHAKIAKRYKAGIDYAR